MLVLLTAFLLLFVAPALLLWTGRLIESRTRFRAIDVVPDTADGSTGSAWFYRPMQPLFGRFDRPADAADVSPPVAPSAAVPDDVDWFYRPMRPIIPRLRLPGFRSKGAIGA